MDALVTLAADVKSVLPNTKVTYAADWSELPAYQTSKFGGPSGEVFFHLDPLWSSSDIDAIGIDNYWPLSTGATARATLDKLAGTETIYDPIICGAISKAARAMTGSTPARQTGTARPAPTSPTAFSKPWVYRFKDIKSWWENDHFDRPGAPRTRHQPAGCRRASRSG